MNRQKTILFVIALTLMGGTAVLLAKLGTQQKLSAPGIRATPIAGTDRMEIQLPEQLLDCYSSPVTPDEKTMAMLPADTSMAQRCYEGLDRSRFFLNVVLMGADRTSIHKARFCLEGQGMQIDQAASGTTTVRVERPQPYDLPVVKLVATSPREVTADGQTFRPRILYVYWFVADDTICADPLGFQRMYSIAKNLLVSGKLQRWAYVSCYMSCAPGQEDATFERMKKLIAASAPEFQLTPRPADPKVTAARP